MKKTILYIAVIAAFLSIGLGQSFACSCMMPEDPATSMKQADGVFVATVDSVDTGDMQNTIQMNISESFKGVKLGAIKLTTGSSSAACGINFESKKEYLVYAYKDTNGEYSASLCSRTKKLEDANEDIYALSGNKTSFQSQKVFEIAQGGSCKTASDGCNTLGIENGKISFTTEMYCPDHTPKYSCIQENEPLICTMQYEPVCGVNGITYSNSCVAGNNDIAYTGVCSPLSKDERETLDSSSKKLSEKTLTHIDSALEKYTNIVSQKSLEEQSKTHKKVIAKANSYLDRISSNAYMTLKREKLFHAITVLKIKVVEMLKKL